MADYTSTTQFGPPIAGSYTIGDTFTDVGGVTFRCVQTGQPGEWAPALGASTRMQIEVASRAELVAAIERIQNLPPPDQGGSAAPYFHEIIFPAGITDVSGDPVYWPNTPAMRKTKIANAGPGAGGPIAISVSSLQSSSGSDGAWTHVLNLVSAAGISVGDVVVFNAPSGITGTGAKQLLGAHIITAVDAGTNRITITTVAQGLSEAITSVTAATGYVLPTRIQGLDLRVEDDGRINFGGLALDDCSVLIGGNAHVHVHDVNNTGKLAFVGSAGYNIFQNQSPDHGVNYLLTGDTVAFGGGCEFAFNTAFSTVKLDAVVSVRAGLYFGAHSDVIISELGVTGQDDADGFAALTVYAGMRATIGILNQHYNDTAVDDLDSRGFHVTILADQSASNTVGYADTTKNVLNAQGSLFARP